MVLTVAFANGTWWSIGLGALVVISAIALSRKGGERDWRWLRWSLALGVLVAAFAAVTTDPWPAGLGLETCESVVNPALTNAEDADPTTIRACSDIGVTGAPLLLAVALALLMIAPDLSEVGIPGLFSLKTRLTRQEEESQKHERQLATVTSQVWSLSEASSYARSQAVATSTTKVIMQRARHGDEGLDTAATAHLAGLALKSICAELVAALPVDETEVAIYRQVPGEILLRQISESQPHVTDFAPGRGATGQAFSTRDVIVVTGEAVHNADYGLTDDQQAHFATTTIVGSAPLFAVDDLSRVIGVITCTSPTPIPPNEEPDIVARWKQMLPVYSPFFTAYLVAFGPESV